MNFPALAQRFGLVVLLGFSATAITNCDSSSSSSSTQNDAGETGGFGAASGLNGGNSIPGDGAGADAGIVIDPTGDGGDPSMSGGDAMEGTGSVSGSGNTAGGSPGAGGTSGTGGIDGTAGAGAGNTSGSGAGNTSGSGAGNASGSAGAGGSFKCVPGPSQCTDCVDNDADGRIDAVDPECTGPLDNDEKTFATGIPGDNQDDLNSCRQDCFFDGNSGAGGGDCQNNLRCDPLRTAGACTFDSGTRCPTTADQQGSSCVNVCKKLTPNGCDCFGCCIVPGAAHGVRLSDTCSADAVNDPAKCTPCTLSTSCQNTCGECELCFGKTSLPASCYPPVGGMSGGTGGASGSGGTSGAGGSTGAGGDTGAGGTGAGGSTGAGGTTGAGGSGGTYVPPPSCPATVIPCGPGGVSPEQCPANTYCITGCCINFVN